MQSTDYDLVILDVMIPSRNGFEVCSDIRALGSKVPILMLTARDAVGDRVRGLDSGADDYLVKPFEFAELLARIRALLRRGRSSAGGVLEVCGLSLDPAAHEVSRSGAEISLTVKQFRLLEYFMRNVNQVLTRNMIAEHVWNFDFENATNVIDVHVRNLRRKVDDPFEPRLIQTVRGTGYRMSDGASM